MFDKLSVKQLKDIIRTYRLLNKISMVVKREVTYPTGVKQIKSFPASKKELIEAMQQHLEITEDGEIVYKQRSSIPVKYKPVERKTRTKKVKAEAIPQENVIVPYESKKEISAQSELEGLVERNKDKIKDLRTQLNEIDRTEYFPEIKNAIDDIAGDNPGSATRNFKKFLGITGEKISQEDLIAKVQKKIVMNPPAILNKTLDKKNKLQGQINRLIDKNDEYMDKLFPK